MISQLVKHVRKIYSTWLVNRLPRTPSVTLTQRRIFIFPGKIGALYVALLCLMFVTSINYQNNLLFSFSCLLVSLFITGIVTTYRNFSGLAVHSGKTNGVFAGEKINLHLVLEAPVGQSRFGFDVGFEKDVSHVPVVDGRKDLTLPMNTRKRGRLLVPRFMIRSYYPLGLLRCWTWVYLDFDVWVYPKPIMKPVRLSSYGEGKDNERYSGESPPDRVSGNDDFYGFKSYQPGDSLRHVAWKQYAKTQQLNTKEFTAEIGGSYWLDWFVLENEDLETRLSILCGWVLQCEENSIEYGLRLPDRTIDKSLGNRHKETCLLALAQYGVREGGDA